MSAKARIMVYRDIVFDDDGDSNDILDVACIPFSIGKGKKTSMVCNIDGHITGGTLSTNAAPIYKRGSSDAPYYTADVTIVPNSGMTQPTSVQVTTSPAHTSYTFDGARVRIRWDTALTGDTYAEIRATCPAAYDGAELGKAVIGTMILGKDSA